MTDIYEQHDNAFKAVAAYAIVNRQCERIATVAFKHGQAITCYFHLIGIEMTKGRAGGGGYDRKSAAFYDAVMKAKIKDGASPDMLKLLPIFQDAAKAGNGGSHWDRELIEAGFKVMQAV